MEGLEIGAEAELGGSELGNAGEGGGGAGRGGADGVDAARQDRRAIRERAVLAGVADEGAAVGAGAFDAARRVAARDGDGRVDELAREAADAIPAGGDADGVAVREARGGVDLAREAAGEGFVGRSRGRGVADGEALADGGVAAVEVADEAADAEGAARRAVLLAIFLRSTFAPKPPEKADSATAIAKPPSERS